MEGIAAALGALSSTRAGAPPGNRRLSLDCPFVGVCAGCYAALPRNKRQTVDQPGHLRRGMIGRLLKMVVSAMAKTTRHDALARLVLGLGLVSIMLVRVPTAHAQAASPPNSPPPQVQQLLQLLQDPTVRQWIDQQHQPARDAESPAVAEPATSTSKMAARTANLREHLTALAAAAPRLPSEFRSAANRLLAELQGRRLHGGAHACPRVHCPGLRNRMDVQEGHRPAAAADFCPADGYCA